MTTNTIQVGQGTAVIDGRNIRYYGRHVGEGVPSQTVLVLHGALGNAQTTLDFANELARLRPNINVFQIDNPGHGQSAGLALNSIPEIARIIESFVTYMQESEIFSDEVILVGHSMGGSIAAQAIIHGFPAKKLVMLQSAPVWPTMAFLADTPAEVLPGAFHEMMLNEFAELDAEIKQELIRRIPEMAVSAEACGADIQALLQVNLTERLPEITVPTLIVHSGKDATATEEGAELLICGIPDSATNYLVDGTHTAVIGEYKRIAQAVAEFI